VAVLTPLLYQRAAEEEGLPQLERPVEIPEPQPYEFRKPPGDYLWVLDEFRLRPFLHPFPWRDVRDGSVGVPILDRRELESLIEDGSDANDVYPASPTWWEFRRTQNGDWAMFPGNEAPGLQITTLLPVRTARSIQLRVLYLGVEVTPDGSVRQTPPASVPSGGCVHEALEDEPGAPYRGRCSNNGCPRNCSPRIKVSPDDGLYRLLGCNC